MRSISGEPSTSVATNSSIEPKRACPVRARHEPGQARAREVAAQAVGVAQREVAGDEPHRVPSAWRATTSAKRE